MNRLIKPTSDGNINIDDEFFLYKEFDILPKNKIHTLAKVLFLMCDPSSHIIKWTHEEKINEINNQYKIEWTEELKTAIDKYNTLLSTPVLVAINTANNSLHTMTKSIKKIDSMLQELLDTDLGLDDIKSVQDNLKANIDIINKLPNLVKTLQELEEKYKAGISTDKKAIGNQEVGFLSVQ